MVNPIADALDETFPSVLVDDKRPLQGFVELARLSVEFERYQRTALVSMITDDVNPLPSKLYYSLALGMQLAFEAGKNYVINGGVDRMLALEDEWDQKRSSESTS